MKFKKFLTMSALCMALISPSFSQFNNVSAKQFPINVATVNTLQAAKEESTFSISNTALASRMMTLLNKEKNSFSSNDIVNHENYKVIKTEISPGDGIAIEPVYAISANTTYLDLSNSVLYMLPICLFCYILRALRCF